MVTEKFACPCCGYKTLELPNGQFDICDICYWEDDPYQKENPKCGSGANQVSLIEGQKNFIEFGACEKEMIINVRQPTKDEKLDENWKLII